MRVFTIAFSDEINHCFKCISKLLTFTRFQSKSKNKYLFSLFDENHNENAEQNGIEEEFDDDVPKMKVQLESLGLVLKEVEGDG